MPSLQFKGKTFVQNHHLAVKYHQLVPKGELSLTEKVSLHDNLIIQGDNLKALKALLPTYAGKVKCIYIDPPYNTGNENWVYNDNVNSPMIKEWLGSVVDKEDLTRHDKWLCMMMPRLKLLRELLSEDGAIFISCDDNEEHRLRLLMDEIFGDDNFIANISVVNNFKGRSDDKFIATASEFLIIYQKGQFQTNGIPIPEDYIKEYKESDDGGSYRLLGLRKRGANSRREDRPNLFYPIYYNPETKEVSLEKKNNEVEIYPKLSDGKDGNWRWGKETFNERINEIVVKKVNGRDEYDVFQKDYLEINGDEKRIKPKSFWFGSEFSSEAGTLEVKELLGKGIFETPKSIGLIRQIIEFSTNKNDIILDSFAGSGTTAHAVLELNKEDGGNRQFILVEQEDYANTITAERVRHVINGVKTAKNETLKNGTGGTFSYFELGAAIEMEAILTQNALPSYLEFARYLFYTATGEQFNEKVMNEETGFIGESRNYEVYLFYKPDIEWLKQNALTLDRCRSFPKYKGKQRLVFAPAKYVDDYTCLEHRIDFCQLPYEIYRMQR